MAKVMGSRLIRDSTPYVNDRRATAFCSAVLRTSENVVEHSLLQMTRGARLFDDWDDDDDDSSVATMDGPEGERQEEYIAQWPNKQFIEETLEQFPEAAVASIEQGRVRCA